MYLIKYTAFLVLLLHQCIVNGFNIFDVDIGFNYLNREINSKSSSLAQDTEIKTRYIFQEIDHFNSSDKREWQMKYFEKLTYWRENGPIYLIFSIRKFLFPYGPLHLMSTVEGLAKETHGVMFFPEHRYYGDSKTFINLDAENIKYLNSRQALADAAKLIVYLKSLPMYNNSKVVVIGASYSGNLAAWMKMLYPELIDAVISIGAPVLAKKDFYEFLNKVKDNYERYGGTECLSKITKKFENYDLLLQSPEGIKQLKIDENICNDCDMTVPENQQLFFYRRTHPFITIGAFGPKENIQFHCDYLDNITDYRSFLNEYSRANSSGIRNCGTYDFNQIIINLHEQRNIDTLGNYASLYQMCTEFGHFPTTTSKDQPFLNIPLEFYIKICSELFGKTFNEKRIDEGVEFSNKLYGGLKPNVTKVVFINGDADPLSTISVLEDLSHDAQSVIIPGGFSNPDLKDRLKFVKYLIRKWIM